MRFYSDATTVLDPATMLAVGEADRGVFVAHPSGRRSHLLDQARDHVIAMGMLEQASADRRSTACIRADLCPAGALTQEWADRLAHAWLGTTNPPTRAATSAPSGIDHGLGSVRAVLPEGYLFYSLFPEWYVSAGRRLGFSLLRRAVVVIGLRSIGTSLSAAVAAGLRSAGCIVTRYTARPEGAPFERALPVSRAIARAWNQAAQRGAAFAIVDEGPGLSGSSLAAAVSALERCRVASRDIHIICAAPPVHLPMASAEVRELWARVHWSAVEEHTTHFWHDELPQLIGQSLGRTVTFQSDLSWGAWAAHRGTAASLLPTLERRKLLLECDGKQVVAKFIGFGQVGRRKAQIALQLAHAGFVPPVLGFAHGMLVQEWIPSSSEAHAGETTQQITLMAAQYYAHLRRCCATGIPADVDTAAECAQEVGAAWFGSAPPGTLLRMRDAARAGGAVAAQGDQRPGRVEWLASCGTVLKSDAADHFLDHSWARDQDLCFDLAGFMQEFDLPTAQRELLMEHYVRASGDASAPQRLPFYHIVYASHRLATLDTAYHAAQCTEQAAIDRERQRMGNVLDSALYGHAGEPCAF